MKLYQYLILLSAYVLTMAPRVILAQECAAYAVADQVSGHMLEASHANKKLQIGSITKIATAMIVLDWVGLSKQDIGATATVPLAARTMGGSQNVGFQPGDRVSLRDLLYAALLQSDNVAAYTLAVHVGRTLPHKPLDANAEELFVAQMNALARKLGMQHTMFLNPSGLDNRERPYSTAADLVLLTKYAMDHSSFRFYVSQRERVISWTGTAGETHNYKLVNTNELLGDNAVDGVKTGRTTRAGDCVVISAARPPESRKNPDGSVTVTPQRLIVVVLGARERFKVAAALLQHGWNLYDTWAAAGRPLGKKG